MSSTLKGPQLSIIYKNISRITVKKHKCTHLFRKRCFLLNFPLSSTVNCRALYHCSASTEYWPASTPTIKDRELLSTPAHRLDQSKLPSSWAPHINDSNTNYTTSLSIYWAHYYRIQNEREALCNLCAAPGLRRKGAALVQPMSRGGKGALCPL